MIHYWLLAWLCILIETANGLRSSMTYHPQGSNPLLYVPGVDAIMHLDQVCISNHAKFYLHLEHLWRHNFRSDETQLFHSWVLCWLVWFLSCFCSLLQRICSTSRRMGRREQGGCNQLCWLLQLWNLSSKWRYTFSNDKGEISKQQNYLWSFQYFPRLSTTYSDAQQVEPAHSVVNLRDQLAAKITNEFNHLHYLDWPNFRYIDVTT